MNSVSDIMLPALAALAAYGFLLFGAAAFVKPLRIQMVVIAENILSDSGLSDDERREINHILDTAISFRLGFSIVLALLVGSYEIVRGVERHPPSSLSRLVNDDRFDALMSRYAVSLLAANPVASVLTLLALPFPLIALAFSIFLEVVKHIRNSPTIAAVNAFRSAADGIELSIAESAIRFEESGVVVAAA